MLMRGFFVLRGADAGNLCGSEKGGKRDAEIGSGEEADLEGTKADFYRLPALRRMAGGGSNAIGRCARRSLLAPRFTFGAAAAIGGKDFTAENAESAEEDGAGFLGAIQSLRSPR
jgi:hypothetical protein